MDARIERATDIDRNGVGKYIIPSKGESRGVLRCMQNLFGPQISRCVDFINSVANIKQSQNNYRSFLNTSTDRVIDIDRIGTGKSILDGSGGTRGASPKLCSVLENQDASSPDRTVARSFRQDETRTHLAGACAVMRNIVQVCFSSQA